MITITVTLSIGATTQRRRYSARRALAEGEAATLDLIVCEAAGAGACIDSAVLAYLRGLQ